ncbi:hypothetical protein RHGRI_010050 [Rhododendron griersonianum]|uniref:Uncharacterized protein n=1 Tax=Rhododendron griersonianum TaxID=479676 RepID=A0AAV6KH02_9ERIC|nr:hypothetical protein RHGRI_010050 [Rhododendron griersonianum]
MILGSTSITPSKTFTTVDMRGLFLGSFCIHQAAILIILNISSRFSGISSFKFSTMSRKTDCMIAYEMFHSLKFNVELSDQTGSIVATVFPRDAEGMFGITAEYMRENIKQKVSLAKRAYWDYLMVSMSILMSEHPSETAGEEDAEEDIFELEEDVTQPPLKKQRAPRSKDGLKVIASLVSKIRDSVRYLKRSPSGKQKFDLAVSQLKLNGLKKVPMDVPIRWNSTYEMLEAALPLRDAFARLDLIDKNYDHNPSDEEWEIATII